MASPSAAPAGGFDNATARDSFIPIFSGLPADYLEWRKRITIYHQKMVVSKRPQESILNIIGSMTGVAWKLVEDFPLENLEDVKTFEKLLEILDRSFQYDVRVQLPADFDFYFGLQRKPGHTLLQHCTDHDDAVRRLAKHDVTLPKAVQGWHLLRSANLTKEQKQLVTLRAPNMEKEKVQEAMFLILGQDHKSAVSHDRKWHKGGHRSGKGYAAYYEEDDDVWDEDEGEEVYWGEGWEDNEYPGDYEQEYVDEFDQDAAYYQGEEGYEVTPESYDVEAYDTAYAAYQDARKRFTDLKLARGYLPVVALADPAAGNLSPGVSQAPVSPGRGGSPKGGGKKGKGKGSGFRKGKGKGATYRYTPAPPKKADPRGRAASAICLRCGQVGHTTASCPIPAKQGVKRSSPTESMANHEEAMVIFVDIHGQERVDCAMMDPGASAFLCGYGPMKRYINYLQDLGFPLHLLEFHRVRRKFHLGGDGESWSNWSIRLPMFIKGQFGKVQVFLLRGETPMLCGRPIIEALGIDIGFAKRRYRFDEGHWQDALLGLHGEYLLPLAMDYDERLWRELPSFDLRVDAEDETENTTFGIHQFDLEEHVFWQEEAVHPLRAKPTGEKAEERPLWHNFLKTAELSLSGLEQEFQAYVTRNMHEHKPKVLWEVYTGKARVAQLAEAQGMSVEVFGPETGWNFDEVSHRNAFMKRLEQEFPDEVFFAPTCGPWSTMQNINARTEQQREELTDHREWHHRTHLQFVRKGYLTQLKQGGHAHNEQPAYALSWKTKAFRNLPGLKATFDQCRYGCVCPDADGIELPVRKPTTFLTTKKLMFDTMCLRCDGSHEHCPLEGSAPGIGRRTSYLEDYQPAFAAVIASALVVNESPTPWEFAGAVAEDKLISGSLVKLLTEYRQEAVRTVQRMHRNLGHPSKQALVELLESRGASDEVIKVAREFHCVACARYKKPNGLAPVSVPNASEFNQTLQSDVMFFKLDNQNIVPVLSVIDLATRYQAATVLYGQRTVDFVQALERCWIRHFGPPKELLTDEGRGWTSDAFVEWVGNQDIRHLVAPGEAHNRLGVVERRHAVLRRAVEIYMTDMGLTDLDGLRQAVLYIVPQINANPTVAGYSPTQWVLGFQPNAPGHLSSEGLNPTHLDGSDNFAKVLGRRAAAKNALIQADIDRKLRRAMLRKYEGTNQPLDPGALCYYWRDARAGELVKIRWLGPARVVMRESKDDGTPSLYWVAHNTQLIRCAPHHVRPDFRSMETCIADIREAMNDVARLKSRGVTRYVDLRAANKRRIDDVDTDEEGEGDVEDPDVVFPPDVKRQNRRRLENTQMSEEDEVYTPSVAPTSEMNTTEPNVEHDGEVVTTEESISELLQDLAPIPEEPPGEQPAVEIEIDDEEEPAREPVAPPTAPGSAAPTSPAPTSPANENDIPATPEIEDLLAEGDKNPLSLYQSVPEEDFAARRLRFARQETLSFGPARNRSSSSSASRGPYSGHAKSSESGDEIVNYNFYLQDIDTTQLPDGWGFDEFGYFQLTENLKDFWEVKAGCMIRHHVHPRRRQFTLRESKDIPMDPKVLDAVRVTVMRFPDGNQEVKTDDGLEEFSRETPWVGITVFQVNSATRRELCMYSCLSAKKVSRDHRDKVKKVQKKVDKNNLSEKKLSVHDRALFQEAKKKELQSFFENQVWQFQTIKEASPERTLTSRMLLKWSKNPDGSPRAKARLIVRGYADVDALEGGLQTSSPTTSRLARSVLMSISASLGWDIWTADVATAFLQGLPQERKLWVKLPADALSILGATADTRMLLLKPCYGQLDAPRRWYLEAVRRLKELGLRQHQLDPCCFLMYEDEEESGGLDPKHAILGEDHWLCGMICLHVDDMLGAGSSTSPTYVQLVAKLKEEFNFREWKQGSELEYCGARIYKGEDAITVDHTKYLHKIKPIPVARGTGPEAELEQYQVTQLRGLMGSLQWPAVQSSPHLQCSVSMLAASGSKGLVKSLMDANRLLKFAKENSDVGLRYRNIGEVKDLRLVAMTDASFASRADGSSQGGYLIVLVNKKALEAEECDYHVWDWRSFKLPRVARSSLSAEAQAAGQATDALELCSRFWEHLLDPDLSLKELLDAQSSLQPCLVTDAKALYDSYHRESVTTSVTDKRTSLEIRVVKEQLGNIDGSLRWVSSERQFADGLTKCARQLLADRLRYGRIKFVWDPNYTAAKKKSRQDREANEAEHAASRPSRNESAESGRFGYEVTTEESSGQSFVAYCDGPLVYKDVVLAKKVTEEVGVVDEADVTTDEDVTEEAEEIEETEVKERLPLRHDALWTLLGWIFNLVRRFILVFVYGIFPKVKAEMALVVPEMEQCDAADEELQVAMAETGMGFAYWHLLILVMVVSFVGY